MPIYSKQDLDLIREKINLVDFLEERGVSLRQSGASWTGLCPIHSERSPSFHVNPNTQTFRCFGCGNGGDVFSLLQGMEDLSFPGAVQELAGELGLQLSGEVDPEYERRKRLYGILNLASAWFRRNYQQLPSDHPACTNLAERNLYEYAATDESVGFSPRSGLLDLMTGRGFTVDELLSVGLVKMRESDNTVQEMFRNRLIWTIYDPQGRAIGFSARRIYENDTGPKYINSPQTLLYNKSKALLGLSDARKSVVSEQVVYVVEGQTDVMAMKAAGFRNTVASCGTAFGTEHANMLMQMAKMGRDSSKFKMVFCFDGDAAGAKAAKSVFEKNRDIHLHSYVVEVKSPSGSASDPCDLRRDYGNSALASLVSQGQSNIVEYILKSRLEAWDAETPEGQSGFLRDARAILGLVADPVQHAAYVRRISGWLGHPLSEMQNLLRRSTASTSHYQDDHEAPPEEEHNPAHNIDPAETRVLAAAVQHPEDAARVFEAKGIREEMFPTTRDLATIVLRRVRENLGFDYSDPRFTELAHADVPISRERAEYGLNLLVDGYLRYRFQKESASLIGGDFSDFYAKQQQLKTRYQIKKK